MTLTEFLEARIAEDERDARQADTSQRWVYDERTGRLTTGSDIDHWCPDAEHPWQCIDTEDECGTYRHAAFVEAEHITRHDPARVLECAAKRALIQLHAGRHNCRFIVGMDECLTVTFLAQPYADHPDLDEAWRP